MGKLQVADITKLDNFDIHLWLLVRSMWIAWELNCFEGRVGDESVFSN
jgi:hypothetical protein